MKKYIQWSICALLIIFLTACNLPQSGGNIPATGGARTWFDAPQEGMPLNLEPYPVVIHSYDPGGVNQVEFTANGSGAQLLKPSGGQGLTEVDYSWNPPSPGNFFLKARSQSKSGGWNSEAKSQPYKDNA